jgi:hypothetical protein
VAGLRRAEECQYDVVEGRAIIIDRDGTELITLSPTGTLVWDALDGTRDEGEITDELSSRFPDVPREQIGEDVRAFLRELDALALVVGGEGS